MKITNEVLEGYLNCKTKGFLKLKGEVGTPSDYEAMIRTAWQASREAALVKLVARFGQGDGCRGTAITVATLKKGAPLLVDATLEDDGISNCFDALKRADRGSKLGDHHYLPVLHNHGDKVGRREKLLLAVFGLALDCTQGLRPEVGLVARGPEGRLGKVQLDAKLYRQARQVLDEIKRLQAGGERPKLMLNKHCQQCEFQQRCHLQAVQQDNLSLLRGMNEKEVRKQARKGIFTLAQLAHTFRPRRKSKKDRQKIGKRQHALHAMAIRDKRVYVLGSPAVADAPVHIYLDLEGKSDESFIYLIGMLVVRGGVEERFSFWADGKDQEQAVFERFLAEVARHKPFAMFCYGAYELAFLRRMRKQASDKEAVDRLLGSVVNVLSLLYSHLYFPCHSNGLKDIGGFLGCTWSEPNASGLQSLVWRARWEATGEEQWRRRLETYNQEDCAALRKVVEFVDGVSARAGEEAGAAEQTEGRLVVRVQDLKDNYPPERSWGNILFVHPDFEHVNKCAYFDYQRERVYARTNETIRRSQRRSTDSRNRKLRSNQQFDIVDTTCPSCKGDSVVGSVPKEEASCPIPRLKRAFDLVLTPSGIRRVVFHTRSSVHKCLACNSMFVPEQHRRLDKHFHGLKAWAMYQHVTHRLTLEAVLTMIEEFFGVRVFPVEMLMIRSLMADYYGQTSRQLLQAILSGNLLHIDETEVKLETGRAYVWVFTNLEEVLYLFRPNREADFLHEMLKDFKGVLVSDFYAGYDSLDCPQQKCLIHLIRDMNQELLANPFDEELRSVTQPFGALLRAAVTTVDEHGLKRSRLQKHVPEVESYFRCLSEQVFRSDAAQTLQARLLKCRSRLFTFLDHDGVPWNNNNAENAVKQFAYFRESAPCPLHEEGLKPYLVLLSLYQSCRYKGVNFLRFLMSGERDLDFFARKGRARERLPVLQHYPEGFMPPHLAALRKREKSVAGPSILTPGEPKEETKPPPFASGGTTAGKEPGLPPAASLPG